MDHERRKHTRLVRPFEGSWSGSSGANKCRIGDISPGGCFVQSLATPSSGESTVVTITFGPNHSMSFSGVVAYVESGMGFAVRFTEMSADELEQLGVLLDILGTGLPKNQAGSAS